MIIIPGTYNWRDLKRLGIVCPTHKEAEEMLSVKIQFLFSKITFEPLTFTWKSYKKHLQRKSEAANSKTDDFENDVKGYDVHDIYTAFDGDILGNH